MSESMARMTSAEKRAVKCLADAWNEIVGIGMANKELAAHIHALQHAVMSRVAIRAHPEIFGTRAGG